MGPGQSIKLKRFIAGQSLLDQLSAERLNTILSAIESKGVIIGTNMTGNWTPSGTIVRARPQNPPGQDQTPFSFLLEDASEVVDAEPVYKVLIYDGEVNGELIDGMGSDDYILTVGGDGYKVYLIVTFDPSTFEILSRSISQAPDVPDSILTSELGTLYIELGFVTIEDGTLTPHNTQCGDVNIALLSGAVNGEPGVFVLDQFVDPLAIS